MLAYPQMSKVKRWVQRDHPVGVKGHGRWHMVKKTTVFIIRDQQQRIRGREPFHGRRVTLGFFGAVAAFLIFPAGDDSFFGRAKKSQQHVVIGAARTNFWPGGPS